MCQGSIASKSRRTHHKLRQAQTCYLADASRLVLGTAFASRQFRSYRSLRLDLIEYRCAEKEGELAWTVMGRKFASTVLLQSIRLLYWIIGLKTNPTNGRRSQISFCQVVSSIDSMNPTKPSMLGSFLTARFHYPMRKLHYPMRKLLTEHSKHECPRR